MSTRPVRCPSCQKGTIAEARPSTRGSLLRAVEGPSYVQATGRRNVVRVRCATCGSVIEWTGVRLVIMDAA